MPRIDLEQRIWFGFVCVVGLLYAFVLPPFQGNDEGPHWTRTWTVARGQVRCSDVPVQALHDIDAFPYHARFGEDGKLFYRSVRDALDDKPVGGTVGLTGRLRGACSYWPLPYVLPALAARLAPAGIRAFWAARIAGWLAMCAAVFWMAVRLPWARNSLLVFLSMPMVIQQSTTLNTDLMLFLLMFVLVAAVARTPSWRGVGVIAVAVVCMTVTRPVYATLGMIAFPALVELWHTGDRKRLPWQMALAFSALFAAPILLRGAWSNWVHLAEHAGGGLPHKDIRPGQQIDFLLHHPLHLGTLFWNQLIDTFAHDPVQGSWRSILAALGTSVIELSAADYACMLLALAGAVFADQVGPWRPTPIAGASARAPVRRWAWAGAALGVATVIPAVVLAMYVYYSPWESDRVEGVQGRYYLVPLFMLLLGALRFAQQRWPRERPLAGRLATALALCCVVVVEIHTLETVAWHYWRL